MSIKIALAGNPNCGKTTLFNAYTGANLKVANWPGVTVDVYKRQPLDETQTLRNPSFLLFPAGVGLWKSRSRNNPGGRARTLWTALPNAYNHLSF